MSSNRNKYGVSAASLFPWCWGPIGFWLSVKLALWLGFDGIQGLPLRGWRFKNRNLDTYLLTYEDAWNEHFNDVIAFFRRMRDKNAEGPLLKDVVLFGRKIFPATKTAWYCIHEFLEHPNQAVIPVAMEINPRTSVHTDDYFDYIDRGGKFCWDTAHVREMLKTGQVINWRGLLDKFSEPFVSSPIRVIHVQPIDREEGRKFLSGEPTVLQEMLVQLKKVQWMTETVIIIEVYPELRPWLWFRYYKELKLWNQRLREIFG